MAVVACKKDKNLLYCKYIDSNISKNNVLINNIIHYIHSPNHIFIIKANGDLFAKGTNNVGQLGAGHCNYICKGEGEFITDNVKSVSIGEYHTAVLKHDDTLWLCGSNSFGQLGLGNISHSYNLFKFDNLCDSTYKQVVCGEYHTVILYNNGEVWVFGSIVSTETNFQQIVKNAVQISSEKCAFYIVDKHRVLWKYNKCFVKEKIADNVRAVSSNALTTIFLTIDGAVWWRGKDFKDFKFITDNCKQIFTVSDIIVVLKTNNEMWIMSNPLNILFNIEKFKIIDTDVLSINRDYPLWSPDLYKYYDPGLKKIIITFLLYNRRLPNFVSNRSSNFRIPRFVVYEIFRFLVEN